MNQEIKSEILRIISFHNALSKPPTLLEVRRLLPCEAKISLGDFLDLFESGMGNCAASFAKRRKNDFLLDKKWHKLIKYRSLLVLVPFVDFALTAGSLALGNAHERSDFDIIVGCKAGRIFTARFLFVGLLSVLGIRRKRIYRKNESSDKVCLGHFVTPTEYNLMPPYNFYWVQLYRSLVPIFGSSGAIDEFFKANDWAMPRGIEDDLRWSKETNVFKKFLEKLLGGKLGNLIEKALRAYQIKRIEKHLAETEIGFEPKFAYNDDILIFHMNTLRAKKMAEQGFQN